MLGIKYNCLKLVQDIQMLLGRHKILQGVIKLTYVICNMQVYCLHVVDTAVCRKQKRQLHSLCGKRSGIILLSKHLKLGIAIPDPFFNFEISIRLYIGHKINVLIKNGSFHTVNENSLIEIQCNGSRTISVDMNVTLLRNKYDAVS